MSEDGPVWPRAQFLIKNPAQKVHYALICSCKYMIHSIISLNTQTKYWKQDMMGYGSLVNKVIRIAYIWCFATTKIKIIFHVRITPFFF